MTSRHSNTRALMAFMHDRPNQWISSLRLFQFGACGWRSRLAEARQRFEAVDDGTIKYQPKYLKRDGRWITLSGYTYLPKRSKRKAA